MKLEQLHENDDMFRQPNMDEVSDEAKLYGFYAALEHFANESDDEDYAIIPMGELRSIIAALKEMAGH